MNTVELFLFVRIHKALLIACQGKKKSVSLRSIIKKYIITRQLLKLLK